MKEQDCYRKQAVENVYMKADTTLWVMQANEWGCIVKDISSVCTCYL
jgi:hypothetical protein